MFLTALEACIQRPGSFVPYCAPTQKDAAEITEQVAQPLLLDCPPEMMPQWIKSRYRYQFPNGSAITLVGLDLHPNRARGRGMDMWIMTEPAMLSDMEYVVRSVLIQQALTNPHARGLMGSTPPVSPGHPWVSYFVPTAKARGCYIKRTIDDNPRIDAKTKEAFIAESGGRDSITTRREYFCEPLVDATRAVIPEWLEHSAHCIQPTERPQWLDAITSLDYGSKDLTAILTGYWHFDQAVYVIEDERILRQPTTEDIAAAIKNLETTWSKCQRYHSGRAHDQPYLRVSDSDLRLLSDLKAFHALDVQATRKDDREAATNALRLAIQQHKLRIHPRCRLLIQSLEMAVWNKQKTSYERHPELGHYDLVDAAIYFIRNTTKRNPFPPAAYGKDRKNVFLLPESRQTESERTMEAVFSGAARRRQKRQR